MAARKRRPRKSAIAKTISSLTKSTVRRAKNAKKLVSKTANRSLRNAKRSITKAKRNAGKSVKRTVRATKSNARKAVKQVKKKVTKKRLLRSLKRGRASSTKALKAAKKSIRQRKKNKAARIRDEKRAQRAARTAATRIELTGEVLLLGTITTMASEDRGASQPGEPPKMRTGKGRDAIKAELRLKGKKLQSRVYVDKRIASYMAMWEFRNDGKARPFLKPSVENNLSVFGSVIGSELKQLATSRPKKKAIVK